MKRLVSFLAIIILIAFTIAMVYFGAVIFDISRQMSPKHNSIEAYFLQSADLSSERVGRPRPLEDLAKTSPEFIRDRLIRRFVTEYLYVIPDMDNISTRTASGAIKRMATQSVFIEWRDNVASELARMAGNGVYRRVVVHPDIISAGDFLVVRYDLITYNNPNDLTARPEITKNNEMRIRIYFKNEICTEECERTESDIRRFLERGGDPSTIFTFVVGEVR
ncbi:MAG: hypothetical protein FWG18_03080 [Alphaproteobacteria bacterium]|nr:hypothetical protein [Alphaproteobacteria bacterium]